MSDLPPSQWSDDLQVCLPRQLDRRRFCIALAGGATALAMPSPLPAAITGTRNRTVGTLQVTAWSDGFFDLPLAAFIDTPAGILTHARGPVHLGATLWTIRTPTRLVLVDAGSGTALRSSYADTGLLAERMADAAFDPADVTDIVITHMHPDHIGGLMVDGNKGFPNATLHVSDIEWRYWTDPSRPSQVAEALRGPAMMIASLAATLDYDIARHGGMLDMGEGVTVLPAPGHTPGHSIVHIASGAEQMMLMADTLICGPMQMSHPDIAYVLDTDTDLAVRTRRRMFDWLATDRIPFGATHMNSLAPGILRRDGAGYAFAPV
ncbi:MBL fold metallo-hydrolase [Jannaschia pohangensis]|uniref:MBL fold metallo-hydrolase n=1 Tax=Jannaschia pohangensis TaxID=390807 RepID=UPI001587476D|nr:MBL fold metallo-hydrolase [Jannaschia pohangensis]